MWTYQNSNPFTIRWNDNVQQCQNKGFPKSLQKGNAMQACMLRFWKGKAPRHFLLGRGHPMRKFTGAFQGHQGNDQGAWRAWRQSPPLPLWVSGLAVKFAVPFKHKVKDQLLLGDLSSIQMRWGGIQSYKYICTELFVVGNLKNMLVWWIV